MLAGMLWTTVKCTLRVKAAFGQSALDVRYGSKSRPSQPVRTLSVLHLKADMGNQYGQAS
jgi:hypothetical protein